MEFTSWHFRRILIATCQVFYFIMWSAYGAYLVTSFVAKPQELTIQSFWQLEDTQFKIGTLSYSSATVSTLQSSQDGHFVAIWERLKCLNKTDPLIFSQNVSVHMNRIVEGDYAYIGNAHSLVNDLYPNILLNYTDIRYYILYELSHKYNSYIGIPTEAFYKQALMKLMRYVDENGTLKKLTKKHFNIDFVKEARKKTVADEQKSVTVKRIGLLLLLAMGGVFAGVFSLVCEFVVQRRVDRVSYVPAEQVKTST